MSPELKELINKTIWFIFGLTGIILFGGDLMLLLTIMSEPEAYLLPLKILFIIGDILFLFFTIDCFKKVVK
jgi:hypothetical protein